MRTVEVEVFKASELTGAAKERAREWYRELASSDDLEMEPYTIAAELLGITLDTTPVRLMNGSTRHDPDIRYSGFSSQGDGASFVGSYSYKKGSRKAVKTEFPADKELQRIADELAELQRKHGYKLSAKIEQSGRYVHKYTMSAEVYKYNWRTGRDEEVDAELTDELLKLMRDFAEWIYRGLQEDYDYRMSDEAVDDVLEANEYDFTADGRRF